MIINAIIQNGGQTCSAGSRVLIERKAYESFAKAIAERFGKVRAGAHEKDLDMGAMINAKQQARVQSFLARAKEDGVDIVAEGAIDAEAPTGDRHDQMVASFNRGYRSFQQSYHSCTPAATVAIHRYLEEGASIGANATIVCGVTIGRYAFIGAGTVVIRDVPAYSLVVGNPARKIGYMCECGETLPDSLVCVCGNRFESLAAGLRKIAAAEAAAVHPS